MHPSAVALSTNCVAAFQLGAGGKSRPSEVIIRLSKGQIKDGSHWRKTGGQIGLLTGYD
jgi:hypothetical protein